jgi:aldehyde dehydrogenase (NAD+)
MLTPQKTQQTITTLLQTQRTFFATGQTRNLQFRQNQLLKLQQAIVTYQDQIIAAVHHDLGRPAFEAYFEIATLGEIKLALKSLTQWTAPRKAATSIDVFPASAWIQPEPLGIALIIGPWNYPFQLVMSPLVGAIAAGNCAILKPSEFAPHTSTLIAKLIAEIFEPNYIAVVEGDREISQQLLAEKFDHIFFTGGTTIGKIVMTAAAQHLTPVTLELGGKSPCIVDRSARLDYTAQRIIWGKFLNAGQTCIAPDYLLVDATIKAELLGHLTRTITQFYGDDPSTSPDFGRIVNQRQLDRLQTYLTSGQILVGGQINPEQRYLAPTILDNVSWNDPVMAEEIFGPILPILTFDRLDTVLPEIINRPKPLALYIFAEDTQVQNQILNATSSGNVCINDTMVQFALNSLPFGGVGDSGMGSCHGKASFDAFSHQRSILKRSTRFDLNWRYAPYSSTRLRQIKKFVTGR